MPNSAASLPSWARFERSAQRSDSSIERSTTRGCTGLPSTCTGGHSSKIITMSEPSTFWMRMLSSGPRNTVEPSVGAWKVTPSSVIFLRCASENTWKPPESVRIGPSQRAKPCSPPCASITSRPLLTNRWKVLPRMISAPSARTCSGSRPLTVP